MPFEIIRNDITRVRADAIVNSANPRPVIGGGTDSAIYRAAGAELLLAERQKIGCMERGEAASTPAFALKAKYIIHTVGPRWEGGNKGEFDKLALCYRNSLALALKLKCKSIAFPLISTGSYEFPRDEALKIALSEINGFLLEHEMRVILVVFDPLSFQLSGRISRSVEKLIGEAEVAEQAHAEYYGPHPVLESLRSAECEPAPRPSAAEFGPEDLPARRRMPFPVDGHETGSDEPFTEAEPTGPVTNIAAVSAIPETMPGFGSASLEDLLAGRHETFQECLFRMIDTRGLKDSDVYNRANIDRKHFSKIRCNPDYHPKKKTAVALAIALHLSMSETVELLSKAELALSTGSKFDIIVSYYIQHENYDIIREINPTLFKYDQPILGA